MQDFSGLQIRELPPRGAKPGYDNTGRGVCQPEFSERLLRVYVFGDDRHLLVKRACL